MRSVIRTGQRSATMAVESNSRRKLNTPHRHLTYAGIDK